MTYSPKPQNLKPLLITIILSAISAFCFVFAGSFPKFIWLLQLSFVCTATAAIQILLKYVLTKFEYECDDKSLYIYKSLGRKKALVGKLELISSASYMAEEKKFNESGDNYHIKSQYVYTRNYKPDNIYVYVTTIGETNFMIKIEANKEFAEFVNNKIDNCLKGYKEYDEI
ncbi:MAG: hypothetical protein IKI97_01905 [Clostridia bacterium]|nr:hypothetical protein [Clostridia bacterium]